MNRTVYIKVFAKRIWLEKQRIRSKSPINLILIGKNLTLIAKNFILVTKNLTLIAKNLILIGKPYCYVMQIAFPEKNWIIFVTSRNAKVAGANNEEI